MPEERIANVLLENHILESEFLDREVTIDCYIPALTSLRDIPLLLINDGQDLPKMPFDDMLDGLITSNTIQPVFCVGIHCATDRKNEYGTAAILDYKGRGAKAPLYTRFVMEELLPFLRMTYHIVSFSEKAFAGFSLGGLCALDIVWNHSSEFTKAGIFSGSLWWRDKDQDAIDFDEDTDRIMHRQVREGNFAPWLKFFFEVGTLDETADRNNNGVIDSIDDTMAMLEELMKKGYHLETDVKYLELADGKHDVETWARAFPVFLEWAWGLGVD
ncbi:MAG: Esterase [Ferruginibacter sp.]|nr:Esterase [Ferruginibacter sp.]